jgi:hypothetical protein
VKTSISIPDELWDEAAALSQSDSPSSIVQDALRLLVADRKGRVPPPFDPPPDAAELVDKAVKRLRLQAQSEYHRGYTAGAEMASSLTLAHMDQIERRGFDVKQWAAGFKSGPLTRDDPTAKAALSQAGLNAWAFIVPIQPEPSGPYINGLKRALQDVSAATRAAAQPQG